MAIKGSKIANNYTSDYFLSIQLYRKQQVDKLCNLFPNFYINITVGRSVFISAEKFFSTFNCKPIHIGTVILKTLQGHFMFASEYKF